MVEFGQNVVSRRKIAVDEVNEACGVVRQSMITTIPGQEMLYLVKEEEARKIIAGTNLPESDFMISAEVGITAPTLGEVAQIILFKAAEFRVAGKAIEGLRLGHIDKLEKATNNKEVSDAMVSFHAGLQQLKQGL